MTTPYPTVSPIRPLVLAAGRGERLQPRTNYLPKPLLPIDGRPLLWYVLQTLQNQSIMPALIMLHYKGELIQAFFEDSGVLFHYGPNGSTITEAILEAAEQYRDDAFLGVSADILFPRAAIDALLKTYRSNTGQDTLLFAKLPETETRNWTFLTDGDRLEDLTMETARTDYDLVALIMTRESLEKVRSFLKRIDSTVIAPEELKKFDLGWLLIVKCMLLEQRPITVTNVNLPFRNINTLNDLEQARTFIKYHLQK